jgi:hypothetical protein
MPIDYLLHKFRRVTAMLPTQAIGEHNPVLARCPCFCDAFAATVERVAFSHQCTVALWRSIRSSSKKGS